MCACKFAFKWEANFRSTSVLIYMPDHRVKAILTVNSPVTASKPTWMVCSKSEGRDISGRSFSFFLFAKGDWQKSAYKLIFNIFFFFLYTQETSKPCDPMCCWAWRRHVEKDTHSCLPRGRWSAGGPSCFSLQEPLEAVWMRDSLMKSLGNYCSFSRGGLVVSLQYQHYQTSLVALTMPWEREKERGVGAQCEKVYV